jgi:hypothetical protein
MRDKTMKKEKISDMALGGIQTLPTTGQYRKG